MNKASQNQPSESGLFNFNKLKPIKRIGNKCIFNEKCKKYVTKHLFSFFYIHELSQICSTNIFFYNCFRDLEMPYWKYEMLNIIDLFNLDIKNEKEEIDESFKQCIEKHLLYSMKDHPGNYVRIGKEGFNIISQVYYDPDMQNQLDKLKDGNKYNSLEEFDCDNLDTLEFEEEINEINTMRLRTPWEVVYCHKAYKPGNIIFLPEKSTLKFGFSFNHVIKGNYKLYLNQSIINMKNAKLHLSIIINDEQVFEINDFPSKKILNQFNDDNIMDIEEDDNDDGINLKETYICDIYEYMFNSGKKKSNEIELKNSLTSESSTESNSSYSNYNPNKKDYTVRIEFKNNHLFWKGAWYLDGGRLVRSFVE